MRVIAGEFKKRVILYPKRQGLRPTRGMVRKAIFDVLRERIEGARVCDLFCGAGSLGIEALSRGAESVTFVEKDPVAFAYLKRNVAPFCKRVHLKRMDVERFVKSCRDSFDIIFLDPPYGKSLVSKILKRIVKLISNEGMVVVEHSKKEPLSPLEDLEIMREGRYGDTLVTILKKE